jgi:ribosomal 50S subunit-recycling heat shock protein
MGGLYLRLDKYLKNSRLIKRRTIAKEACDSGRVLINGKTAKAGSLVHVGDIIEICFGDRRIRVKVTEVLEHAAKEQAKEMYDLLE